MEPTDLNSSTFDDADLEARLRQPAPSLPDDGFSARVIAALPPMRPALNSAQLRRLRGRVSAAGALLGIVVAVLGFVFLPGPRVDFAESLASAAQSAAALIDPSLIFALVVTAGCLLYVFRPWSRSISLLR